ncbi:MAPEG family protein (plasmid) [Sphingomonas paeninsulae]|uniref:MAPEG family protein n=2 Tax=Sphingomonas paeninsulae TaxID=2319844 RepID=A0A494T774_SPHPE|nr:MAPEG family protein [Sphingomonas paeninsulae]
MTLPITLITAAALGTISLWLGLRIFRMRLREEILIGDDGNDKLAGRMRAHANLVEYAPFVLILMALIEVARGAGITLAVTAALFILARIANPIGMDLRRSNVPRASGAIVTWVVLAFLVGWGALIALGLA